MMNGGDLYELVKTLGQWNIKMRERYAKLARQHIARTNNTARKIWKLFERATPKVKCEKSDVRVLCGARTPCVAERKQSNLE